MEAQIENLFFKGPLAELMRTDRLTVGLTKNIGDQKLWGWNGVKTGLNWGLYGPLWGAIWSNEVSMNSTMPLVIGFQALFSIFDSQTTFLQKLILVNAQKSAKLRRFVSWPYKSEHGQNMSFLIFTLKLTKPNFRWEVVAKEYSTTTYTLTLKCGNFAILLSL